MDIKRPNNAFPESIQSQINSGKLDFEDYFKDKMNGYEEVEIIDEGLPLNLTGHCIKYFLKSGVFRSGGFITVINNREGYLVFRAYNKESISLQYNEVERLFVKPPTRRRKKN